MPRPGVVIEFGDLITRAARTDVVKDGIGAVADDTIGKARGIAAAVGANAFGRSLKRVDGIRPGSKARGGYRRPFARVIADAEGSEAVEHGGVGVTRQSILARAAGKRR